MGREQMTLCGTPVKIRCEASSCRSLGEVAGSLSSPQLLAETVKQKQLVGHTAKSKGMQLPDPKMLLFFFI